MQLLLELKSEQGRLGLDFSSSSLNICGKPFIDLKEGSFLRLVY